MPTKKRNTTKQQPRTLRDDFALFALQGLCTNPTFVKSVKALSNGDSAKGTQMAAEHAYVIADAMLAARTK